MFNSLKMNTHYQWLFLFWWPWPFHPLSPQTMFRSPPSHLLKTQFSNGSVEDPTQQFFHPYILLADPMTQAPWVFDSFFYFCALNIIICFTAPTEKVKLSMDSRETSTISTNPLRAATSAMALCASYCPPTISLKSSSCLKDFLWGNKCLYSNNVSRNPCTLSTNWSNNSHASRWCTRIGQSKLRMLWPTQMGDSLLAR